jgi:hypothetical protein
MLPKDFIFVCENMPYLARVCMPEKVATDANYVFGMKFGKPKAVFASDIVDTVQSDFDPDNIEEKLHIN